MHPAIIVLVGVVIVIGGVLLLRLHAFLALVLAALTVALLTPRSASQRFWVEKNAVKASIEAGDKTGPKIRLKLDKKQRQFAENGTTYLLFVPEEKGWGLQQIGKCRLSITDLAEQKESEQKESEQKESEKDSLPPEVQAEWTGDESFNQQWGGRDDVLAIRPAELAAADNQADKTIGEKVAGSFGNTCGKIGILIALAAIIGKCLLDSGSADRIVRSAMRVVGERGAPVAFVGSGFLLGIPVFFDTVFYLMMPLGKALRMRTGRNYLLYVLTIVAGASMAHSLVPPTPGPLLVANELGVDLGTMILAGTIVGLFTSTAAMIYATFVNRFREVPLRESPDFSLKEIEEISKRSDAQLPPLAVALLPILLPVLLIAGNTVAVTFELVAEDSVIRPWLATLGNKNIALAISTIIALATLVWARRTNIRQLGPSMQGALASGGVIILITAGGGAFGATLQQTGVAGLIRDLPAYSPTVILTLAFLVTTAIRTAQGSATVAMITAVGILASFAAPGQLGCHPVYLALAIGCGSKPVAWMNDSGFWVICKMSGMTESEGLSYVTPMSILMGVVGLGVTLLGANLLPLV